MATHTAEPNYCIITGANSGIGKEVTKGLMQRGAHVVMACRNMQTCAEAKAQLDSEKLPGTCTCARIDLEDYESVRQFAKDQRRALNQQKRKLDVLVNNAGVMGVANSSSGEDRHLIANHLGPYLLTRLLLPTLGPGSRIVNVASRAHYMGDIQFDEQGDICKHPTNWWAQYARSKLCNVLFTAQLNQLYQQTGIHSFSVSPGLVDTHIFNNTPGWLQWAMRPFRPFVFRTPAQGADTVIYAATAAELVASEDTLFLHDRKPMKPLAKARDMEAAEKLWAASEKLVGWNKNDER